MDIMDSTDTPTGGLDQTTASPASSSISSSSALPLSVDQRDDFASPTNRSTYGGQQPTSSSDSFAFSSAGSAFDKLDAAAPAIDENAPNAMPTSTDDVMMPRVDFASHPSMTGDSAIINAASTSTFTTTPTSSQQAKDKASSAMDAAKDKAADAKNKAADMADSAKAKASDMSDSAKAKAADMKDSAKLKAADMKDSAKSTAADMQNKMEDTADSVKEKLEEGAEKVKEGGHRLLEMAKSGLHSAENSLHSAEKTVEDKIEHVKEDLSSRTQAHKPTAPVVRSTNRTESTDTHPSASSMRDPHLHPGLTSLPSHGNEITPDKSNPFMSDTQHNALIAADAAHARALANGAEPDPKDVSARGGMLHRLHDKVEDAAEVVKEHVDGFMERNVRVDNDEHLSAAKGVDLPTLIDASNTHNTDRVRGRMHPSAERTLSGVDQDD